jgi:hypothetical protein
MRHDEMLGLMLIVMPPAIVICRAPEVVGDEPVVSLDAVMS